MFFYQDYLLQEYAGFGGNAQFFKNDVEFQANKSLFLSTVSCIFFHEGLSAFNLIKKYEVIN